MILLADSGTGPSVVQFPLAQREPGARKVADWRSGPPAGGIPPPDRPPARAQTESAGAGEGHVSRDLESLRRLPLARVEELYRDGEVSKADFDCYLGAWNATPGRLAALEWRGARFGSPLMSSRRRSSPGGIR